MRTQGTHYPFTLMVKMPEKWLSSTCGKSPKNSLRIISKPHAYFQTMFKSLVKFQRNWHKTVGGVAHTRYPLYIYFDGKTLHNELAPILQLIFQRSLDTGKLPHIWKEANVSPIFKKGEKSDPSNYRPISLTCVLCKVLEYIVASSVAKHFTELDILYDLQHGF